MVIGLRPTHPKEPPRLSTRQAASVEDTCGTARVGPERAIAPKTVFDRLPQAHISFQHPIPWAGNEHGSPVGTIVLSPPTYTSILEAMQQAQGTRRGSRNATPSKGILYTTRSCATVTMSSLCTRCKDFPSNVPSFFVLPHRYDTQR